MSADQVEDVSGMGEEGHETNKQRRLARKAEKQAKRKVETGSVEDTVDDETEVNAINVEAGEEEEGKEDEEDVEAVSHKEMRKRRRAEKQANRMATDGNSSAGPPVHPSRAAAVASANSVGTGSVRSSRHSIWVGNLSFRTSAERLQEWFEEKGIYGISRVNMPKGPKKADNNRGFAYVDVPTAEALQNCIDLSESHLDGRRLLIKSGSDYSGRPEMDKTAVALASGVTTSNISTVNATEVGTDKLTTPEVPHKGKTGLTKTAQKILRAQKHSPGPTLFIGNLSFNSTEDGLREMVERSAAARDEWSSQKGKRNTDKKAAKGKKVKSKNAEGSDSDSSSSSDDDSDNNNSSEEDSSDDDDEEETSRVEDDEGKKNRAGKRERDSKKSEGLRGAGIRKIRMGQFEDTGKCKGFAFIDFFSPEYATASLIDPRNGRLDGRELKLQYAGADAVRRGAPKGQSGGGPRPFRGDNSSNRRAPPKRQYNDAFAVEETPIDLGPAPIPGTFDPDAPMPKKHKETKEERIKRRESQNSTTTRRAKPGAALANAQRGKTGIEIGAPQGVKKTFE